MKDSSKIIDRIRKKFLIFSSFGIVQVSIISYFALHLYSGFVSQQALNQELYTKLTKQLTLINQISFLSEKFNEDLEQSDQVAMKNNFSNLVLELSKEFESFNIWMGKNSSVGIEKVDSFLIEKSTRKKMNVYLRSARELVDSNSSDFYSNRKNIKILSTSSRDGLGDVFALVSYKISVQQQDNLSKLKNIGILFIGLCVLLVILVWILVFKPLYSAIVSQHSKLSEALLVAKSASRSKTDFLANISHEIRTPMTAILGYLDFLKKENLSSKERIESIGIIDRNANHLLGIIDEVLDISKIEAGKFEFEVVKVNLSVLLNEVYSLINVKAKEKNIELKFTNIGEIPLEVKVDPKRVKQILFNIIGNAIKFTEKGSVELSASYLQDSRMIILSVKDTGVGIPNKVRKYLFRPFQQADSSVTRKYGGTGLGLVLSRDLARTMGGDVKIVNSKVDEGTTFEISFKDENDSEKLNLVSSLSTNVVRSTVMNIDDSALKGSNLLVVDDAKENLRLFKHFLTEAGANVETAADGFSALEIAKNKKIDLILLDLQMPGKDGFQVIKELRENSFHKPVVALTAHAMEEEKIKTKDAGFDDHISKPVKAQFLVESVRELIHIS